MTPKQRRRAIGIGQEITSGTPVTPMQWVPEKREKPWWAESEFWNGDELEMGGDGVPLLVEEAQRRGANYLRIDHTKQGKIDALRFMKCHLFTNYCCMPDMCRNAKTPNKKCRCSNNRMLSKLIDDINFEMHITLNPTPTRSL